MGLKLLDSKGFGTEQIENELVEPYFLTTQWLGWTKTQQKGNMPTKN